MFDFDLGKMILFGVVALVVVGPHELPAALRLAGRMLGQARRMRSQVRKSFDELIADVEPPANPIALALSPATAMRSGAVATTAPALDFISPEMREYLAPEPEAGEPDPCAAS